jgi:hypothetical protein
LFSVIIPTSVFLLTNSLLSFCQFSSWFLRRSIPTTRY